MKNINIKNMINEEVQKVLNESYVLEDENFKFRQEIKTSTFYNYESFSTDFDVDINESDIFVNWHVVFWLNDFGIEHFGIDIDSVEGTYKLVMLNRQTDETEQETDKNIAETNWTFEVQDAALHLGKTLYIETLDFDFKTKKCKVSFYDYENY